jgi:hypothetical protein
MEKHQKVPTSTGRDFFGYQALIKNLDSRLLNLDPFF